MKKQVILTALIAAFAVTGCANKSVYSGNVYTGSQAKEARGISYGTIVSVREVQIQAPSSGVIGTTAGGAIGGIAGSSMGGGRGSDLLGVLVGTVGAVVGNKIEQGLSKVTSLEMVIRKDDGSEIVVVQKKEAGLTRGARVRLVGTASDVNVSPL